MTNELKAGVPSDAYKDMEDFFHANKSATTLLNAATADYAAAQCLAQNQMITSLIVGAQALEKYLKAYILLVEPSFRVRKYLHGVDELIVEADRLTPNVGIKRFVPLAEQFLAHYQTRYPDNPRTSMPMSTIDIEELDNLVLLLNENLSCPRSVKYRSGLYGAITFSVDHPHMSPTEHWIKLNNQALSSVMSRIIREQIEVLTQIHPGWVYDK